ncbi:hypothetical protein [Antribacter gilvus]|uniref:hypothetical protein n=1 Tax=Antribacter gilvus TaxID=2304675 RepID=UPI000F78C2C6|nr:hypothetical protein [Antribacter gilvus]
MDNNERDTSEGAVPDEAFERLAAADPATSAPEPVAGVLRARIDALVGDGAGGSEAAGSVAAGAGTAAAAHAVDGIDGTTADGAPVDELAARRRRRSRWLAVAAAGAVAVAGGGGYVAGAGTGGPVVVASTAAPAITLGDVTRGNAEDSAAQAPAPMNGAATSKELYAADSTYPAGLWGRLVFHAGPGLAGDAGQAPAYGLDAEQAATAEAAARAAEVLGISGEPREEWGWAVGPTDGSGPMVTVGADGEASLQYWDPTKDPWYCPVPADGGGTSGSEGSSTSESPDSAAEPGLLPVPECPDGESTPEAPDTESAVLAFREILQRLGVDLTQFEIETGGTFEGDPYRNVTAHHVVDGKRSGLTWNASVTGEGLSGLYGFLAPVVELGEYPVISAAEAVERLGDPRFGASGGFTPMDDLVRQEQSDSMAAPEPTVPPAPTPGDAIGWPVTDVTITSARLGLARHSEVDGTTLLLPSYELRDAEGSTWSVVAVADEALDFAP